MDKIASPRDFPRQFARTRRFSLGVPGAFTLAPDGGSVLFVRTRGPQDAVGCLWRLDADGERLLADPAVLGGPAAELPEAERTRRERARIRTWGSSATARTRPCAPPSSRSTARCGPWT